METWKFKRSAQYVKKFGNIFSKECINSMYKICYFETVVCDIIHGKEISEILCIISPEHDILYALFYCGVTGLPIRRVPLKYQFYYYVFITGLAFHYRLWSFNFGDTKSIRRLHKSEAFQRIDGEPTKFGPRYF